MNIKGNAKALVGPLGLALFVAASSAAVAGPCSTGDVSAVDSKVYPATFCRQLGSVSTVSFDSNGRVLNPSTSATATVVCPIVRDHGTLPFSAVRVVVGDRSPSANVTCYLRSNQVDGLGWVSTPTNPIPVGAFDANWWSSRELIFDPPTQERDFGTYLLVCLLPAKNPAYEPSGIYSYRVDECADDAQGGTTRQ